MISLRKPEGSLPSDVSPFSMLERWECMPVVVVGIVLNAKEKREAALE